MKDIGLHNKVILRHFGVFKSDTHSSIWSCLFSKSSNQKDNGFLLGYPAAVSHDPGNLLYLIDCIKDSIASVIFNSPLRPFSKSSKDFKHEENIELSLSHSWKATIS